MFGAGTATTAHAALSPQHDVPRLARRMRLASSRGSRRRRRRSRRRNGRRLPKPCETHTDCDDGIACTETDANRACARGARTTPRAPMASSAPEARPAISRSDASRAPRGRATMATVHDRRVDEAAMSCTHRPLDIGNGDVSEHRARWRRTHRPLARVRHRKHRQGRRATAGERDGRVLDAANHHVVLVLDVASGHARRCFARSALSLRSAMDSRRSAHSPRGPLHTRRDRPRNGRRAWSCSHPS